MLLNCGVGEDSLRVPWTARRSNQSILKEISPEYSWEGLMLKLKLQYFGYLIQRADSVEKTLMLGKIEGRRRRGWQRMRWLVGTTDSVEMSLSRLRKLVMDREAWCAVVMRSQRVGHDWATELNWKDSLCPVRIPMSCCRRSSGLAHRLIPCIPDLGAHRLGSSHWELGPEAHGSCQGNSHTPILFLKRLKSRRLGLASILNRALEKETGRPRSSHH